MLKLFNIFKTPPVPQDTTHNSIPVVLLHGANQTSKSFSYIKKALPDFKFIDIDYDSHNSFEHNLEDIIGELKDLGPVFVLAHSLGGVYAVHLTKSIDIVGAVTLATPYGGSSLADWARYIVPGFQLFRDIGRRSQPIAEIQKIKITVPWLQIVGTRGNVPWLAEENDGVLTLESVMAMPDIEYVEFPVNHYEIVCDDDVISTIVNHYSNTVEKIKNG